jgi:hypothetical protein
MLIKKLYYFQDLYKRIELFDGGELSTAFIVPNIFLVCNCEFWSNPNNENILIIKVTIETKETLYGTNIYRKLNNKELIGLRDIIRNYVSLMPEHKIIYIYE